MLGDRVGIEDDRDETGDGSGTIMDPSSFPAACKRCLSPPSPPTPLQLDELVDELSPRAI